MHILNLAAVASGNQYSIPDSFHELVMIAGTLTAVLLLAGWLCYFYADAFSWNRPNIVRAVSMLCVLSISITFFAVVISSYGLEAVVDDGINEAFWRAQWRGIWETLVLIVHFASLVVGTVMGLWGLLDNSRKIVRATPPNVL